MKVEQTAHEEVDSTEEKEPAKEIGLSDIVVEWWPLLLGNVLEWYEFGAYGYVADLMQKNFFGGSRFGTLFGFAITFMARPLGGIFVGWAADRWGRRPTTLLCVAGMTAATVGQGLLPLTPGLGVALLLILRFAQGIFAGGEVGSISSYFAEAAPPKYLARCLAFVPVTALFAFALASSLVAILTAILGPVRMLQWGWRIPFLVVLPPGFVAAWGRSKIQETECFQEEKKRREQALEGQSLDAQEEVFEAIEPVVPQAHDVEVPATLASRSVGALAETPQEGGCKSFFKLYGWRALFGFFGAASFCNFFYLSPIWCIGYLKAVGMDSETANWLGVATNVAEVIFVWSFATIADRVGAGTMATLGALAIGCFALPLWACVVAWPGVLSAFFCITIGFSLLVSLAASGTYLLCAELFPTEVRAMGFSLSFNLSMTYFGGLGGLIAEAFRQVTPLGPGIYISVLGIFSFVVLATGFGLSVRGRVQLAHLRAEPFLYVPACFNTRSKVAEELHQAQAPKTAVAV